MNQPEPTIPLTEDDAQVLDLVLSSCRDSLARAAARVPVPDAVQEGLDALTQIRQDGRIEPPLLEALRIQMVRLTEADLARIAEVIEACRSALHDLRHRPGPTRQRLQRDLRAWRIVANQGMAQAAVVVEMRKYTRGPRLSRCQRP